jgi:hypothetical protein
MAERTGLEPATPGVTGRYSNQLNYRSNSRRAPEEPGPLPLSGDAGVWGQDPPSSKGANRN